jgi:excinuclease ABC subunit C
MDAFLEDEKFTGFGTDPFYPFDLPELQSVTANRREQMRASVRTECPRVPGVYGMIDRRGRLIYVGKSKSLRSRLLSYFLPVNSEDKQGRIVEAAERIVWETQPSEFAALLREQQLIRRWTPRWNVQGIPKRQRPVYLVLGRSPAAMFYLSRLPVSAAVACEGPFFGAGRMNRAIDALNKFFKLRDCSNRQPMRFAEQLELFARDDRPGCLRYEIGNCLGPCVAACTRQAYNRNVQAAQSFIEGMNGEPVVALQELMESAASNLQFELASRLRDDLQATEYLHRKLLLLSETRRRCRFIYAAPGPPERTIWYFILSGEVTAAVAAPRCRETFANAKKTLLQWQAQLNNPDRSTDPQFTYTLPLVAAWFRKHSAELSRTLLPHEAGRKYRELARAS